MAETVPADVVGKLREGVAGLRESPLNEEIVTWRKEVLNRFQPVFSAEHVAEITESEFRSFLLIENNHHWSGLQRMGPRMCSDMTKLRKALSTLVDETRPVAERLDEAVNAVSGMGKNVVSAILTVAHPDHYGVWNNRSESIMKDLRIWPIFDRRESFGKRYVKVNQILLQLRDALQIDLWELDALWWYLDQQTPDRDDGEGGNGGILPGECQQGFGLERHLHEFLRDNWDHIELGRKWQIYAEPGDEEAGYEYPCDVGRIDLLAKHREAPQWLVVELKRNQTSDQTIGQVLRYMGWVNLHLAEEGDEVRGLIICREADDALRYALSTIQNVELQLYEVEFRLKNPPDLSPIKR